MALDFSLGFLTAEQVRPPLRDHVLDGRFQSICNVPCVLRFTREEMRSENGT